MRRMLVVVAAIGAPATGFILWWRRHPRFGVGLANHVVNPWLVRRGVADSTRGEIALLEHVGRVSGTRRVTPVHPVATAEGIRIIVPLGSASEWCRNVLAAGHCRVQTVDRVLELDTPRLVDPTRAPGVNPLAARAMSWLGFRYLLLRGLGERPGPLETAADDAGALAAVANSRLSSPGARSGVSAG